VFLGRFFIDAAWYFYLFWLPEFLKHEKGFNLDEIGRIAWMPFLAADLGAIAGGASATWLQRRGWGTDRSHKTVMLVGNLLLCSPLVLARTENIAWSVVWICAGTFAIQMWGANVHAIPTHLFHSRTVGSVSGLAGACGALGGILLMRLVGYIVDHFASYGLVLYVVGGFCPLMAYLAHRVIGPVRRVG
jgi:ACS family hexuronate transporter-like MFS transporter